jgi:hypothetical protein
MKIFSQNLWPWLNSPTTTQCIHQLNKHLSLQSMVYTPNIQGVHKIMNPTAQDQAMLSQP